MKPYTHFTLKERICLEEMRKMGKKISEIAEALGKNKSTISRELKRNSRKDGKYTSWGAETKARVRRHSSVRKPRIQKDSELYKYICENLKAGWSPEIITRMWKMEHPNESLSFVTIYKAIRNKYFEGITANTHLRRRGKKRCSTNRSKFNSIQPEHTIHERSQEIENRERCGDWEGDTLRGAPGKGGLVTLVDRKARFLIAILIRNFCSETVYRAVVQALKNLHPKSITFDNGSEFAKFREMEAALNTTVYFADPHSPWQRGSNENINDVLRFYFPKGCNFKEVSQDEVDAVVDLINNRPRFCLGLKTPIEIFCCT